MESENETFDEVLRCIQNDIVHFVGKPVKHSRDLLQEYHDRFKAAHQREVAELERKVAELRECLKDAVLYNCAICDSKGKSCEVKGFCLEQRWRKALKGAEDEGKRDD